ncbi:LRR receptor-like kinase, putative [Medicago truncatula]|uniref:LRR receptor-like kinase, putative n=1 Tax=Medicago truncatula TaxID=3880 RepID=A0A072UEZ8_MEDTR|nr:LRR receptor-like kinase, putative [Medicago truncatula]
MSDHVIGLDLSCNNLKGELHPNSTIFQLKHLQQLNLAFNNFSESSMPIGVGDLVKLTHLNLSYCYLSGNIPSTISHLSKLVSLDLSSYWSEEVGLKLKSFIWKKLIHNATNLRELHLNSVDMSSITESSLSMLKNFSSSLVSLLLRNTGLQGNLSSDILSLPNLQRLDLSFNDNLSGQLPKSNLSTPLSFPKFQTRNLQRLDLSNNNIHGKIPKWFHKKLLNSWNEISYIDLSFNKLQGDLPIPPSGIQYFSLSNNNFTGNISSTFCNASSLYTLNLAHNNFQGDLPIPPDGIKNYLLSNNNFTGDISSTFCNASYLNVLNLAHNNLTGMIPQCLGTLTSLNVLDMQMNNLYGNIPRTFSKENAFQTIKLNGNQLEGPLPQSLSHCSFLEVLDLGDNNIEDTFPNWLETLQELQVLSLRSNNLHGAITCSSTKHSFPKLRIFDVSINNFSGPLPTSCIKNFQGMMNVNDSQIGLQYKGVGYYYNDSVVVTVKGFFIELTRILTAFTTIDLSNNMFEGEIPQVIGELNSLKGLNLSNNGITGSIPQSLSHLRNLEWLDLSCNQLKGEIPVALTNLNFLSVLNLSQNHLEGIIPKGQQFNTFGNDSFEGNTMLCGFQLSKSCKNEEDLPPHSTSEDEEESGFGWKAVAIGYGCGAISGFLLGYNVFFFTGKPQWLVRIVENMFNIRLKRTNNRYCANRRRMN